MIRTYVRIVGAALAVRKGGGAVDEVELRVRVMGREREPKAWDVWAGGVLLGAIHVRRPGRSRTPFYAAETSGVWYELGCFPARGTAVRALLVYRGAPDIDAFRWRFNGGGVPRE